MNLWLPKITKSSIPLEMAILPTKTTFSSLLVPTASQTAHGPKYKANFNMVDI